MIIKITIGAPNKEVTAEIFSSVGAKILLAIRSLKRQNTDPERKDAGISTIGFDDLSDSLIKNGTAIPINETGPANAVTQADKMLDNSMMTTLQTLMLTPTLFA